MRFRRSFALGGALAVLAVLSSAAALAAGTRVSVRVEGLSKTLLSTTITAPASGSITAGGAPAGSCPAASAAGALDLATHHKWSGTYSSGLGIEITSILGETHKYSANGYYWGIWVNDRFASAGICDLKLRAGEQLLFAPAPAKGTTYPIVITAPGTATAGHAFQVKVVYDNTTGKAVPLAGATVTGAKATTTKQGIATITPSHSGKLSVSASLKGYIRSAVSTVTVTR